MTPPNCLTTVAQIVTQEKNAENVTQFTEEEPPKRDNNGIEYLP